MENFTNCPTSFKSRPNKSPFQLQVVNELQERSLLCVPSCERDRCSAVSTPFSGRDRDEGVAATVSCAFLGTLSWIPGIPVMHDCRRAAAGRW